VEKTTQSIVVKALRSLEGPVEAVTDINIDIQVAGRGPGRGPGFVVRIRDVVRAKRGTVYGIIHGEHVTTHATAATTLAKLLDHNVSCYQVALSHDIDIRFGNSLGVILGNIDIVSIKRIVIKRFVVDINIQGWRPMIIAFSKS